ncbi:MAG: thiol peroxidase [bacterium]
MNFFEIATKRRSVNFFDTEIEITESELEEIINLAALAPSGSNTQPWEVVAVKKPEAKQRLQKCAFDQPKVSEASVTLIMLADPEAFKGDNPTYESFVRKGYMDEEGLEDFIEQVEDIYTGLEQADRYAVKNTALFAMSLMYSAKSLGWDTHPMIGFNPDKVKEEFQIPDKYIIPMLISLGKFDEEKELLPRNDRKAAPDFVSYDKYEPPGEPSFANPFVEPEERIVTMEGNELHLDGRRIQVGDIAPDFTVLNQALEAVVLEDLLDKPLLISSVPSLDTSVCSLQTKTFNEKLQDKENEVNFVTISCDTVFAQERFCSENSLPIDTYSDINGKQFGLNYGLLVRELGLCARAVLLIDTDRKIRYIEIVNELTEEPDYSEILRQI